jgi:hypothetical protein
VAGPQIRSSASAAESSAARDDPRGGGSLSLGRRRAPGSRPPAPPGGPGRAAPRRAGRPRRREDRRSRREGLARSRPRSRGSTTRPARGAGTTSRVPPTAVATTGRPPARASRATIPSGSTRLTRASRSHAATQSATCSWGSAPVRITAPSSPSCRTPTSMAPASGPSPTKTSRAAGRSVRTRAKACISPSGFLRSVRPPTARIMGPAAGWSRRARAPARSPGVKRSRSTPMFTTWTGGSSSPDARRPSARWRLTAMTELAPRSAPAVALRTLGRSRLRTSWPWAVTT